MSGLINKAKEMLGGHGEGHDITHGARDPHAETTGPTGKNTTGSSMTDKLDPRVDSDRDRHTHGTTHGTSGYGDSTTSGLHRSNLADEADPRVDSDRDGSRGLTGSTGYGSSGYGDSTTSGYGDNTTSGPHRSDLANRADPTVDSDGSSTFRTPAVGGNVMFGGPGEKAPHHTTMTGEALDPHIGSTGRSTGITTGSTGLTGSTGTGYGSSTTGEYGSSTTGNYGNTTSNTGSGYGDSSYGSDRAPNTSGPHGSDMMNKLDPRVDRDRDGSKTYGQDRDTLDARQVPPSVMRDRLGHPTDEEGQISDHGRRHSTKPIDDLRAYGSGHQ